ncbi:MAG: tRNA (N6-isopentenyl adenosine(37)-C2)-methylthiotransferase MiaB [Desulfobacteraceae bacterium]|nr:tRNA (N6-isopentenyl adenosine(37)-C2)-methylthiotransferase MiaB [Desulfobacteraceae bacterium]
MRKKTVYIHTIGCQMNVYDTERMFGVLSGLGYVPAESEDRADVIIVNTCAIRAKAEQKVFSYIGRLAPLKRSRPNLIIAVGGCVAQQEGGAILRRMPMVDLVFGTHAVGRLADRLREVQKQRRRIVDIEQHSRIEDSDFGTAPVADSAGISRFVTIMHGCDNYCTYCVVPYVRGRESSRRPERILDEIRGLVAIGAREVTLLGQNVNSYGCKEGLCSFPELLHRVAAIDGLERIRFTTSHPKDLSQDLIDAFRKLDKLCNHIHLPVQSGSDRILRKMNRGYTLETVLDRIGRLRKVCPDIAVTTDFIVGFPGETDSDFEQTLNLMESVSFDGAFAFAYSDRPKAPARRFGGKISESVKQHRLSLLLKRQDMITARKNAALVGSRQSILVEGLSPKHRVVDIPPGAQWMGRTPGNKIVHFLAAASGGNGDGPRPGRAVQVRIDKAFSHSLWGTMIPDGKRCRRGKGEHHASQSQHCGSCHGPGIQHTDHHFEIH